jgi:putative ABC transport system substrate-binding protein
LLGFIVSAADSFATDVLVVESLRVKPFDEAVRGFRSACRGESKTVVLSDSEEIDLLKTVREERPKLIIAIGSEALQKVYKVRTIPVLYLMVLNPERILDGGENFIGVEMNIPPERYLELIQRLYSSKLKIGILFDPSKTGSLVKKIQKAASSRGIELEVQEIHNPRELPNLLSKVKGSFNVFWMLPDSTVVTSETVKFLSLFFQQNRLPVVTFSGKYLQSGALISLDIDEFDMGKQGGEMANRILEGSSLADISNTDARKVILRLNRSVAENLGIDLNSLGDPGITN